MSIKSVMPSNHLILCHPLLLLPSIFLSVRVFSNESALWVRWPKFWSFSFTISPCNEYSGLISFRMDWLDLLAVQATLKSLLQSRSSNPMSLMNSMKKRKVEQCSSLKRKETIQVEQDRWTLRLSCPAKQATHWSTNTMRLHILFTALKIFLYVSCSRCPCRLFMQLQWTVALQIRRLISLHCLKTQNNCCVLTWPCVVWCSMYLTA